MLWVAGGDNTVTIHADAGVEIALCLGEGVYGIQDSLGLPILLPRPTVYLGFQIVVTTSGLWHWIGTP